ncbi:MAG: oxygen-independent coproporphyrinogen III oxidase [Rhizobiaceae bacterium]
MKEKLLAKYSDERLPRYTSYPTAPNFTTEISPDTHRKWITGVNPEKPVSLYFHIPFCRSMCWYCGCHTKVTKRDGPIEFYLQALEQELMLIAGLAGKKMPVGHVHFGGGTPTIIEPQRFLDLFALIRKNFKLDNTTEIAVEIDPRTLTMDMVSAMAEAGVNRASLGVQSFDLKVQKAINRVQSKKDTAATVNSLKNAGIHGINFDLIYGLPKQDIASCIETAQQAVEMKPDRFSVFGYAHVPEFKRHQKMISESDLPDGSERLAQAEAIATTLAAAGYRQIGLDHYALPGDMLSGAQSDGQLHRNFQGYTTDACQTLIGFGASSISRFEEGYIQNDVSIGSYRRSMSEETLATTRGYAFLPDDQLRAKIIERLMCDFAVDLKQVCGDFGQDYRLLIENNARLNTLIKDKLAQVENGNLVVKQDARFIIRNVAAAFDAYLGAGGRKFSRAA